MYKNKQRNKIGTHLPFPICLFCVPMSSFLFTLYSFNVSFAFSCTDFIHTVYFVQCSLCSYVLFLLLSLLSFSLSDCLYFWPYFIVFFLFVQSFLCVHMYWFQSHCLFHSMLFCVLMFCFFYFCMPFITLQCIYKHYHARLLIQSISWCIYSTK